MDRQKECRLIRACFEVFNRGIGPAQDFLSSDLHGERNVTDGRNDRDDSLILGLFKLNDIADAAGGVLRRSAADRRDREKREAIAMPRWSKM